MFGQLFLMPYLHSLTSSQRGETDFFSGEPLRALSTLVFSDNVDLQRSASLTFAEITERGTSISLMENANILGAKQCSGGVLGSVETFSTQASAPLKIFGNDCSYTLELGTCLWN
jgi:hypothetical protein